MNLKIKITNLDKPNRNNQLYTKECIEKAADRIRENAIPIRYISDKVKVTNANFGYAKLVKDTYPELEFDATVNSEDALSKCVEEGVGGFALGGLIHIKYDAETGISVIDDVNIRNLGYTMHPSCEASFEIIKE